MVNVKPVDRYIPPGSKKTPEPSMKVNQHIIHASITRSIPVYSQHSEKQFIHQTAMKKFTNLFEMKINSGMSYL